MSVADFLKERPCLSMRRLEIECDIPLGTLNNYVHGRRKLGKKHIPKLIEVLTKYGFKPELLTGFY